jgi:long-subunit fatty acid transport protein
VKIPLGEDEATQNGIILSEDMQPSSGSYSALAWGYLGYAFDQSAQTQIFISSNFSLNQENDRNYANGDEFNISIGGSYTMKEKWGFVAQLRYRTTESDERNGDPIPNTGGEWIDFVPSVQYRINDKSGVNLSLRIPLYRNLDGALQFTTSSAATLGYSYAF